MKLQRLRVAELRQFRAGFELADLQPGLNIFTGANEAGKSTLVRAIRAAFFERHRSTSVDDLRPYGDSAAAPTVELDFEIGGTAYRLSKSFLQKKRCELVSGTRRWEGVEAEDLLATMLGFQFALKGASREEHWGIPGLLWMEQGEAQAVRGAVANAAEHLRKALDASLGEVAASSGDEIATQVQRHRDELLTGTGKPRAAYQKAIDDAAALDAQVEALAQAVTAYRSQVDQLARLRDEHTADAQAQPWLALRAQQRAAEQALSAADALAGELAREAEQLRQATGLRELLLEQLLAHERQRDSLFARAAALAAAVAQHDAAVALEAQCVSAETAAAARRGLAQAALTLARQEDTRTLLARQLADAQVRATDLATRLDRATAEHERAATLRQDAARLHLPPTDLSTLRDQRARLTELDIRQAAVATRLRLDLEPGASVELAGAAVTGQLERLLVAPTTVVIAGVGRLHIAPGGSDLAELAQLRAQLVGEHQALLQRLGLASPDEAETRERAAAQQLADAAAADKACKLLAPKGLDSLRSERDAATARQADAAAALGKLPTAPTEAVTALDTAERDFDAARAAAEAAGLHLQASRQALASAASQRETAGREHAALRAVLDDPQVQADLAAKQRELIEAGARETAVKQRIVAIETRIAAARPDILRQDVERLRRSADEAERQHQARDRQIAQLEAALAATGAQGLEEELAQRQSEATRAAHRQDELRRRADALDFLLQRLDARRQALTRRLQAPLQKHLDRYLQLLFGAARLEVDPSLVPGALTRSGPRGTEVGDFETLSFGAREQMGVLSRLAYADLLKEAGRPTLLILDDALVHSDAQRLAQMKRALFDAAQRHQVLLFTCHPAHWRDMGVPLRALEEER